MAHCRKGAVFSVSQTVVIFVIPVYGFLLHPDRLWKVGVKFLCPVYFPRLGKFFVPIIWLYGYLHGLHWRVGGELWPSRSALVWQAGYSEAEIKLSGAIFKARTWFEWSQNRPDLTYVRGEKLNWVKICKYKLKHLLRFGNSTGDKTKWG